MPERPIIFSGPMVRAILAGRKTQTRRLAQQPPTIWIQVADAPPEPILVDSIWTKVQPGDRLWVRETWQLVGSGMDRRGEHLVYPADGGERHAHCPTRPIVISLRKRPSIHMPRWASRITLEVTAVRRQRLQAIDEADVLAEGLRRLSKDAGQTWKYGVPGPGEEGWPAGCGEDGMMWEDWKIDPRAAFASLWNSLHDKPCTTWADNPEVVSITFRVLSPAEASRGRRDA